MTEHKEQDQQHHAQQQAHGDRDQPEAKSQAEQDVEKGKARPIPMTAGTPPRPMTPNEIISTERSYTDANLDDAPEGEKSATAQKSGEAKKEK